MKILFYGDSITDALRKDTDFYPNCSFGYGYVIQTYGKLIEKSPTKYEVINRGISGNRIVDLYSRIKADVWNHNPDLVSILVGINDIWHEVQYNNGVDVERFEKVYKMMLEDTIKTLPNVKIILAEPFVLPGSATNENYEKFLEIKEYAKVVKKLAEEFSLYFLPLQSAFDEAYEKYGEGLYLYDGVHPSMHGSVLLANEWMKLFNEIEGEINK